MSLNLFPHNKRAYEAAMHLMEEEGKAAIIHPTGTGKSFIAFQLAVEHPNSHILWLAPSEYIYQTQLENLKKVALHAWELAQNIQFLTYAKLMFQSTETDFGKEEVFLLEENENSCQDKSIVSVDIETKDASTSKKTHQIEILYPDYIILDEFHRCGAVEWGKSVEKLLSVNPQAKLLGLSATNIRYLDGQRDMAVELFDGVIASEMTLGEAIAKEILPAPTYVISMYAYQEELKKLQKRIEHSKNPVMQQENKKLLEDLRRALEQAEGLDTIFVRHMPKGGGKFIVFCSSKEHMEEMVSYVHEWFHLVDTNPNIYAVTYDNPETSKAFADFKADESSHLRLLFCIDMLNEGIHVENIDGVILLRPTVSPIIYLQQIGRSLSAGKQNKNPLIFDIVNNFDSLYTIDSLQNEIEDAFALMPCTYNERAKFQESFRIFDEIRDCRELFTQLNRNLSASWEFYYIAAMEYYNKNGHLRVPKSYVTESGLTLGMWLQTQRRVNAGKIPGNLSAEQKKRLDALGMEWECGSTRSWNRGIEALKQYKETYGNVDVHARYIAEDGYALGKWISNIRSKWNRGEYEIQTQTGERHAKNSNVSKKLLSVEQIQELDDLGMIWDKHGNKWEQNYKAAEEYFTSHGNLKVPHDYRTENGIGLGVWIANQRSIFYGKKEGAAPLSAHQIERLNAIEMVWK